MNIIEAIQAAENGWLITNNFLKPHKQYLKYVYNGIFNLYDVNGKEPKLLSEQRTFFMHDVLTIGWEKFAKIEDMFN